MSGGCRLGEMSPEMRTTSLDLLRQQSTLNLDSIAKSLIQVMGFSLHSVFSVEKRQ